MSSLEFPSLFCCQSAAETNAPVHCHVKSSIFGMMELQRGVLTLPAAHVQCHGTDSCFFSRHPVTRLEPDSKKKAHSAQSRAAGHAIKSSRALRLIPALTTTLEKVSVATCINAMAKTNPAATTARPDTGKCGQETNLGRKPLLKYPSSEISA